MKINRTITILFLLLMFLGLVQLQAVAAIPAEVVGEYTVSADETISHNIVVSSSGHLIINPGVTLIFLEGGGPIGIRVEAGGRLSLNGEASNKVKLTTDQRTILSGWNGIDNSGTVAANYAEFWFASEAIGCRNNGSFSVEHSLFRQCSVAIRVNRDRALTTNKFKVFSSDFVDNGHAFMLQNATAPLNDLSQIYGNTFTSNTHNFYFGGDNNVQIRNNLITTEDGEHIFEFGQKPGVNFAGQYSYNEHVYISFNNFYFVRSNENENEYFVGKVDYGSPVGIYDCYWNYNGTALNIVTEIRDSNLCNPYSSVAIYRPLSDPLAIGTDSTAPELVELSPERSKPGQIYLTVVIQETGWGVDPATVDIKVGGYQATVSSYTYNSRHYIFDALVNIPVAGDNYTWEVSASDLAGNAMTGQTLNGQKLIVANNNLGEPKPPQGWESFSAGVYQLVTLPVKPLEKDHKTALGLKAPGSTIARWDFETKKYIYYGDSALELFEPGKGFWVRFGTGESFAASPIPGELKTEKFKVFLNPGWHLIGDPFHTAADGSMPFNRLTFHYGNTLYGHSFIEAVNDGYVGFGLWGYTNGNYRLERERLKAWQGYWLYVKRGCEIQYWPSDPPLPIPNSNIAWEAQLTVSQSGGSDSANYFGMARSVAAGADNFDTEKPPAINSTLKSFFALRGVAKEYGADLRPTNTGRQTWEYVVQGLTPGEARLGWNNLQQVPLNYQIILKDRQTGQEVDLRRSNSYVFEVSGETERRFDIELVDQGAQSLQITNLRMSRNPFAPLRESELITFNLNANATVDIKIYDWVGNLVYGHPVANASAATEFQFTWNGRNNLGRMVANGVYFCKIIAKSGIAQATQVLKLAVVN